MFIAVGIIGVLVGLVCLLVSKDKIADAFRKINQDKGTEVYSEENIAKRIRLIKIAGPVALIFGALLVIMEITGF